MSERNKSSHRNLLIGSGVAAAAAGTLATSLLFGHHDRKPAEAHSAPRTVATPTKACPEAAFETPEKVTFDEVNPSQTFLRVKMGACATREDVTMLDKADPDAKTSIVTNGDEAILHPGDVVDISCYMLGTDGNRWWYVNHHGKNGDDPGFVPANTFGRSVDQAIMNGSTPYSETVQTVQCNAGGE